MNNASLPGFAGGNHSNNDYEGPATTGELGPELWIHDGQPYLTGIHGRNTIFVSSGDQIFTAAQTKQILDNHPELQDIPGFSSGYGNKITWGTNSTSGGAGNNKTKEFEPERYHVITRQLKELERLYDKLNKAKEKAYGTNILDAIQKEIDATNQLIEGQQVLIDEAQAYLDKDLARIKELGVNLQLDEMGNIANWEELQDTIGRAAAQGEDENAVNQWKAIQQYEETLDKLHEAQDQMQDYIYQLSELALEKITTTVELVVSMDDREIKFIDHFLNKLDDDIYDAADALDLVSQKMGKIKDQIDITGQGLQDVLDQMKDEYGQDLADDQKLTLEKILEMGKTMTGEQITAALDSK